MIGLSAFFSASETAFFSLHASRVRLMKDRKEWNAERVERLKSDPERLLVTILVGNTIVNISAASYATALAENAFGSWGIALITGGLTVLILLFGEIIPKSYAYSHNARVAQVFALPLRFASILLYPGVWTLDTINRVLNRFFATTAAARITEEEVLILSRMSVEKGGIGYDEHELIERVFRFDDTTVGQVMTPIPRAQLLDGDVKVDQIAYHAANVGHSRYPVFHDDEDNIIGYVHTNALMRALNSDGRDKPVSDFMLPIQRLDEHMSLERAFRAINRKQSHLALVHAHHDKNKTLGIVTLEDILEELVGEIEDETDG